MHFKEKSYPTVPQAVGLKTKFSGLYFWHIQFRKKDYSLMEGSKSQGLLNVSFVSNINSNSSFINVVHFAEMTL